MDISESLDRILHARDTLGKLFYDHFLSTHPEVQRYFDKVDFNRQRVSLVTALMVIERYYADPAPAVEQYLQYLGTKHSEMGIPGEEYPKWIEAMVETMAQFHGDQWTPVLEKQWREAFGKATESMLDGYEQSATE
jgi:hemoglobin-like flavoprotein